MSVVARLRESSIFNEHVVEVVTVLLISLAAVATAWCGYQSKRWSALQTINYASANAARIQSSIAAGRGDALRTVDVGMFIEYQSALYSGRTGFAEFLRRRFRPEFRAALDAWLATHPLMNPQAPLSPFAMKEYRVSAFEEATAASKRASDLVNAAVSNNEDSDRYVFATVLFALTSFLGGISVKSRYPVAIALLAVGLGLFTFAIVTIAAYPVR